MKSKLVLMAVAAFAAGVAGCGGGSDIECGAGTVEVDGVCTADPVTCGPGTTLVDGVCTAPDPVTCTDGTILDPTTNSCVIDPDSCQDGTVLVAGQCVDPGHVTVDVEEGTEPNGLGLFGEVSAAGAGDISIAAVGTGVVVHGTIVPFQDVSGATDPITGEPVGDGFTDPDVDTYLTTVTGPTLITVTADGLHGLAAGYVSLAAVAPGDPLANWQRFGINLTGDTSSRSLYLPAAGTYVLTVADTRTLFLTGGAAGSDDPALPFEYYVTITQATAVPEVLTISGGLGATSGMIAPGEVKLYSVAMGEGINTAELDVRADQAIESTLIVNTSGGTTAVEGLADGDPQTGDPASVSTLGIRAGDTTLVVVDNVYNYAPDPVPFDLSVTAGSAGALSTSGGDAVQAANTIDFTVFYYDVASDLELTGMDLGLSIPVTGVVVDEDFFIFANFTFDPSFGFQFNDTFTSYRGLLRHPTAGRYYFLVYDPTGAATTITATSSYAPVAAEVVTKGTPTAQTAINPFASNPYTYAADVANDPWQQFGASGVGSGNIVLTFLDPTAAFGRLDPLASTCVSGGTDFCADVAPVFSATVAEAGGAMGRVMIGSPTSDFLVTARTATVTGGPTFALDFQTRPHTDLGTLNPGTPITDVDAPLDTTTTVQRYLVRTASGNGVAISTTPDQPTLNTRIQRVFADETNRGTAINNGGAGAADLAQFFQTAEGWTAFTVTAVTPIAGGTFDLAVSASPPVTYTASTGATAFSDACVGGTPVTLQDGDEGFSVATVATPAGFDFFGFAQPQVRVNSNGFVTMDTSLVCSSVGGSCFFGNQNLPSTGNPNGVIAAYWDDLVTTVCQQVTGTRLTLQWTGTLFASTTTVSFQMILDGSNDTIELVYGPAQVPTGQSATIGIEDQAGTAANLIGFNVANTIMPGVTHRFTPN